jgi:hypothetical protein
MNSNRLKIFGLALVVIGSTQQAYGRLPGTLNFHDISSTHVDITVGENTNNEKEVEYGDFDNDGDLDVVVAVGYADFQQRRNKLYRNDGGLFFEVSGGPVIPGFSDTDVTRNAFFRDYDGDGWLDIIVVNDNNTDGQAGRTKIYMNNHPDDVFSHFTEEGIARLGDGTGGAACGAISYDVDGVNGPDLYVGNYPGPSQDTMYLNNGDGYFSEVTSTHVPLDTDYTVDVASADLNGDGKVDLLVSNDFDPNFVYYNDLNEDGAAVGDFKYGGSIHSLGTASSGENSMEPGDFDNDGDQDIYWSGRDSGGGDVILVNTGNDDSGKAVFSTNTNLPSSVTGVTSRKATVEDLNLDGRLDIMVMKETLTGFASRPTVLRNVTIPGQPIHFVDWTPGHAFPDGAVHKGWHAAAFDADSPADGYPDLFVGGWSGDFLMRNVPSNEVAAADIGGMLPSLHNIDPVAVLGSDGYVLEVLSRSAGTEQPAGDPCPSATGADTYSITGIPVNGRMAVVLNGCGDYALQATRLDGTEVASSDRGGSGVEEFLEFSAPGGTVCLNVTIAGPCDVVCVDAVACCDNDDDGIRDDACTWCDCEGGSCETIELATFGDTGGAFGACAPDGTASIHDRTHVIRCFEETTACHDVNADAGGPFVDCAPDGACDLHDANHALESFAGTTLCSCDGPSPEVPTMVSGQVDLAVTGPRHARPGELIHVHVSTDSASILRGYQLQSTSSGGRSGSLVLQNITIEPRRDRLFSDGPAFEAFNIARERMFAGLAPPNAAAGGGRDYLVTFVYRASTDAAGTFSVDLDPDETFLVGENLSEVRVNAVEPLIVTIGNAHKRRDR